VKPIRDNLVSDIERKRFLLLLKLFEISKGNPQQWIKLESIDRELQFDHSTLEVIIHYLQEENLIELKFPKIDSLSDGIDHLARITWKWEMDVYEFIAKEFNINNSKLFDVLRSYGYPKTYLKITDEGIQEIREARKRPSSGTLHFSRDTIYYVFGSIKLAQNMQNREENYNGENISVIKDNINSIIMKDVNKSFNKIEKHYGNDIRNELEKIRKHLEETDNIAASELFKKFSEELSKQQPEKTRLEKIWSGIQQLLPSTAVITESISKISTLLSSL
jgi:hypothetical protein